MSGPAATARTTGPASVFLAVLWRDIFVTGRELPIFLIQVILQPLFLLFVFGKVLSELGYTQPGYSQLLFPGVVSLTAILTALQSTALPLVIEFSFTKEIEDRLLAPMPTALVAVEKMVFAAIRAIIAALVMFPIGVIILGSVPWHPGAAPMFIVTLILGTLTGAAMGLVLGTAVPPNRINVMFTLVLTPLLFTGCVQYPWPSLDHLRWFQIVTLFNPMTYISEGMRGAMVPSVPHIRPEICLLALVAALGIFSSIGIRGFIRRAID